MADRAQVALDATVQPAESAKVLEQESAVPKEQWGLGLRIAFRFCVAYFTLFGLSNQILGGLFPIPKIDIPELSAHWPLRHITFWTATHIFHIKRDLVYTGSGSGDKTFDWVLAFCLLIIAALITCVWSILDRRRENYVTFHKWFRLAVRFALASEMFLYGLDKVIPLQMPFPYLSRLLEPYGNFSPMAVLWSSIGASRSYEIFTGCAETLGGILLLAPRTATLGALVCLADMIQVFMLNMTYDVPVKLFSFHLVLFSLFLLAPDLRRLLDFFFTDRVVAPSRQTPLFRSARANRIAVILQVAFGLYLMGMGVYGGIQAWHTYGGGRPKSALYGIWNVDEMSVDGQLRPALFTDHDRWRRVVFDFPTFTSFQRPDDTFTGFSSTIGEKDSTLTLTKAADKNWKASFTYARPAPDQLVLNGSMDGHQVQIKLKLLDRNKFMLVNRGFHWINEYPFQR
ncbi:MAG TPA: DoxX family protein [Candidatus Binatia bacterium]|nr:DoxX family protein [Candidatus Binatia bacterium]